MNRRRFRIVDTNGKLIFSFLDMCKKCECLAVGRLVFTPTLNRTFRLNSNIRSRLILMPVTRKQTNKARRPKEAGMISDLEKMDGCNNRR